MIANYHTHTWRCNHAVGTEVEYVEKAISNGLKVLGFSDHTPYLFPGDYYSGFRMAPSQLPGYVRTVLKLKEEYKEQLEIHLGLETEYYPDLFPKLLELLSDHPMEYMILGQHLLGNEMGEVYCGSKTEDEEILRRYCYQSMDAMNTGKFTYFAHPDLIHYVGSKKIYQQYMREVCQEANSCHMPVELNLLGLAEHKHYPNPRFWEIAAEENCQVVLGRDAHDPNAFDGVKYEKKALKIVKKLSLNLQPKIDLRPFQ